MQDILMKFFYEYVAYSVLHIEFWEVAYECRA